MNIRQTILKEIMGNVGVGACRLAHALPTGQLEVELAAVDTIGCQLQSLSFRTPKLERATADELKQLGARLTERLTYLMEPIAPIELDREGFTLQLRSNPPQRDDDGTSYFEVVARRGELSVSRWRKTPGQPRAQIAANLTHEILARLASDVVEAAG